MKRLGIIFASFLMLACETATAVTPSPTRAPSPIATITATPIALLPTPTKTVLIAPTATQTAIQSRASPSPSRAAFTPTRTRLSTAVATKPASTPSSVCPQGCTTPPPGCAIKGNISSSGEKIHHVPGGASYGATQIDPSKGERWFCVESEAIANGWRKAQR